MSIKAIKLISGEELIGEVLHEESVDGVFKEITMKNVLAIVMQRTGTGDITVGFIPFAPYLGKNATFEFADNKLLFVKEVDEQMKNQYNSIFGGIMTPPKSLIVG